MNLLIEAVEKSSPDRTAIRDALKEIEFSDATIGPIEFDNNGNRIDPVFMIQMIKGHPVIFNH